MTNKETKFCSGTGTRVIANQEGLVRIILPDQSYELQEGEKELCGVRSIDISISVDTVISALIDVYIPPSEFRAVPELKFVTNDPNDKFEEKVIKKIEFEDGSIWEERK